MSLLCLQVSPNESLLMLVVHHIISDAWALQLLASDLNTALEAALEHDASSGKSSAPASEAVAQKLDQKLGHVPLQQMDYSAWLQSQLVSHKSQHHETPSRDASDLYGRVPLLSNIQVSATGRSMLMTGLSGDAVAIMVYHAD